MHSKKKKVSGRPEAEAKDEKEEVKADFDWLAAGSNCSSPCTVIPETYSSNLHNVVRSLRRRCQGDFIGLSDLRPRLHARTHRRPKILVEEYLHHLTAPTTLCCQKTECASVALSSYRSSAGRGANREKGNGRRQGLLGEREYIHRGLLRTRGRGAPEKGERKRLEAAAWAKESRGAAFEMRIFSEEAPTNRKRQTNREPSWARRLFPVPHLPPSLLEPGFPLIFRTPTELVFSLCNFIVHSSPSSCLSQYSFPFAHYFSDIVISQHCFRSLLRFFLSVISQFSVLVLAASLSLRSPWRVS
ncbi:uncharacterized protein LOC144153157 [Haemaphysalis longicornis]